MLTYKQSLKYLDSFLNYEREGFNSLKKEFDLGNLHRVLERMDSPQEDFISVHVGGTKGKGSICTFASSILEQSGYKVGLYTSPHLVDIRERININGDLISEEDFAGVLDGLKNVIEEESLSDDLTYFEVLTLAAISYFSQKKVDYAVFEVGMGGRLDATNVINAKVCCISPISYDHTHILGSTIEEIAREKAGIIKKGSHCIVSPQRPEALEIIRNKCLREGASFSIIGKDITFKVNRIEDCGSSFDVFTLNGEHIDCRTKMPGEFQPENCASAIGIYENLFSGEKYIDEEAVKRGAEKAYISGRLEILSRKPLIVIDGAQNRQSAAKLKYSVEQIFKYDKLILLLGVSKDKDIKGIADELIPLADEVVLTRANVKRAADPDLVRGYVGGKKASRTRDVKEALGLSLAKAKENDMILAAGSFYVIGEIKKLIASGKSELETGLSSEKI